MLNKMILVYCIVQNIRGTKLSWLGHLVSIRGKLLRLYKKLPYPCHCNRKFVDKTFTVQGKTEIRERFVPRMFCSIRYLLYECKINAIAL